MEPIPDEPDDALNLSEESGDDSNKSSSSDLEPQPAPAPPQPETPPEPISPSEPLPPQPHIVVLGGSFLNPFFSPNLYSGTSSVIPFFLLRALAYLSGSFGDTYLTEARRLTLTMIPFMNQVEVTEVTQHFFTYDSSSDANRFQALYEPSSLFRSSDSVRLGFAYIARSLPLTFDPPPPPPSPTTTSPTVPVSQPLPSSPLPILTAPVSVPLASLPLVDLPNSSTRSSRLESSSATRTREISGSESVSESVSEPEGQAVAKSTLANSEAIAAILILLLRKPVLIWDVSGEGLSQAWEIAKEHISLYSVSSVSYRKTIFLMPDVGRFEGGFLEIGVVPVGMRLNYSVRDVDGVLERESSGVATVVNRILSAEV